MTHKFKVPSSISVELIKTRRAEFDTELFLRFCQEYNIASVAFSEAELGHTKDLILKSLLNDLFLVKTKNNRKFYISNTELPQDMIKECIIRNNLAGEAFVLGYSWFEYKKGIMLSYEGVEALKKKHRY